MVIDIWWHYKICASYRTSPEKRCKCRKRDCNKKQGTATTGLQFFLRFPPPTPTPQGTNERTKTNIAKQTVTRTTHFASRCCRTPSRAACNEPREPPYTALHRHRCPGRGRPPFSARLRRGPVIRTGNRDGASRKYAIITRHQ